MFFIECDRCVSCHYYIRRKTIDKQSISLHASNTNFHNFRINAHKLDPSFGEWEKKTRRWERTEAIYSSTFATICNLFQPPTTTFIVAVDALTHCYSLWNVWYLPSNHIAHSRSTTQYTLARIHSQTWLTLNSTHIIHK